MNLDGSPKAKAVYEQSSKILFNFKQKWGIPQVSNFSPFAFFAGPNFPPLKVQNVAKSQNFSTKLHPQEYQLTQSQGPEFSANYVSLFFVITIHS